MKNRRSWTHSTIKWSKKSMHRECWNCGRERIQDAATEWQCPYCDAWNDCEET